ncbi:MAG: DUF1285 domain-containing protein [Pseudomonadales bacterium]|nr:DUF1285 domain-containing protein [Pseudomonadales bacterium]
MRSTEVFELLSEYINTRSLPPVHQWHPEKQSEIDIRIDASGDWFHEGGIISRVSMVRLFASILRKDGEAYYLVTPVEMLKIQVDDVPFFISNIEATGSGKDSNIAFVTSVGDCILLDKAHPLVMENHAGRGFRPYITVRCGMQAVLARSVYYHLAELCSEQPDTGFGTGSSEDLEYGVWSAGKFFLLAQNPNI